MRPVLGRGDEMSYPHEFLGRCATCLDNANLASEPCRKVPGLNGSPVIDDDCLIYKARKAYDQEIGRKKKAK